MKCCYNCPKRFPSCSSSCEIYKNELEDLKRRKEYLNQFKVYPPIVDITKRGSFYNK